jgi:ribonuclease-3
MVNSKHKSIDELQAVLDISFKNRAYLEHAMTHSSFVKYKGVTVSPESYNERLEFFGDSVLKFMVSEYLFNKYPSYTEGDLSKLRSKIISDSFLAQMAKEIKLGDYLRLSPGEEKSRGNEKASILANTFEALLGACYLDQGLEVVKRLFFSLFDAVHKQLEEGAFEDFKTALQELCQKRFCSLPSYRVLREDGPDHDKRFTIEANVTCNDDSILLTQGCAESKKQAEQFAAKELMDLLKLYKS